MKNLLFGKMLRSLSIFCFVFLVNGSVLPKIQSSADILLSYDEHFGGFYGQISMGSPPQAFNVVIDILNSHFWVASDKCSSSQYPLCKGTKFESEKSTTYNTSGQIVQFVGSYLTNEGYVSTDIVNFGDITLEAQEFIAASSVRDGVDPYAFTGTLGLALGENSSPKMKTITEHLLESKVATKFSLHFDSQVNGQLNFGNSMQSPIVSAPVSDPNNWQFIADQITVGNQKFCESTGCKVNIDSQSNFMMIPGAIAESFLQAIHAQILPGPGIIFVPAPEIPKVPNLDINVNGQIMSLNITDYSQCEPGYCVVLVSGTESAEWTLGLPFLFKYDSEFNFADKTISFKSNK
ncbi:gastricsin-like [Brevipalpus obovatus]|uniref:gastricsin-like n=1 Tax=Brevipalpus obovatus TaxID=246614 RepID=UPI003D9DF979